MDGGQRGALGEGFADAFDAWGVPDVFGDDGADGDELELGVRVEAVSSGIFLFPSVVTLGRSRRTRALSYLKWLMPGWV